MMLVERYRGAMLGLAAGDALGTTLEFSAPGSFSPVTDMIGGGPFRLKPGQWTDDTSMALCLAESLIKRQGFDPVDQLQRYVRWWRSGHLSSTGTCFDIGNTVATALARFQATGEPWCGSTRPRSAGNGSLMRLAPVALAFRAKPREAIQWAAESSRTTHGAREAVDACRYYAGLIVGALRGASKSELLASRFSPLDGEWPMGELCSAVESVASGSFRQKTPPAIRGSGYVIESLEAALWALDQGATFEEGALLAVNLGDDADTTGAIYGQLAGTLYGEKAIPVAWGHRLAKRDLIVQYAEHLLELSQSTPKRVHM